MVKTNIKEKEEKRRENNNGDKEEKDLSDITKERIYELPSHAQEI
jgi:hypothetical protein